LRKEKISKKEKGQICEIDGFCKQYEKKLIKKESYTNRVGRQKTMRLSYVLTIIVFWQHLKYRTLLELVDTKFLKDWLNEAKHPPAGFMDSKFSLLLIQLEKLCLFMLCQEM